MVRADPPVAHEELEQLVREYRHLHEEHRRARRGSSARRRLGARVRELEIRFERLLAAAPVDEETRRRWRDHLRRRAPQPDEPRPAAPLVFRGRSRAGSELLLTAREDGSVDAVVDGTTVERLDAVEELDATRPGVVFRLGESGYGEIFVSTPAAREALRTALEDGEPLEPAFVGELLADGLVDRRLDVTPRGRRALALDLAPAHPLLSGTGTISVQVRGAVSGSARLRLEEALAELARLAPRPLLHARASLERAHDPAVERPVVAKAQLDVGGRPVHARTVAATASEAVDRLAARLRRSLRDLGERDEAVRREGRLARPGEWRHGDLPARRPPRVERPPELRRLVRRVAFAADAMSPEEAAWELRLLDHEFHLFPDAESGEDAVVYVRQDGNPGLKRVHGGGAYVEPFLLDPEPAPTLSAEEAAERLAATDERFVFFVERESARGAVVYRRDDGHDGLVAFHQ